MQKNKTTMEERFDKEFGTYITHDGEYGNDSKYVGAPVDLRDIKIFISQERKQWEEEMREEIMKMDHSNKSEWWFRNKFLPKVLSLLESKEEHD